MYSRPFWQARLEKAWQRRPIVWLAGARRVGKTSLCKSLENVEYFDCELPRIRRELEDPESFLKKLSGRRIVLDEVHRLPNPSEILKIAADHFPEARLVATGSSTLGTSAKFRDTLAGRKAEVWLTPMSSADLRDFGQTSLEHRLLRGGLPPFFLAEGDSESDFQEWMDAFWAKDILELFRLERRASFQRFLELLMVQSGGIFEASSFARPCEVSRTTISNYLAVLDATFIVHVLRPWSTSQASEIVSAPKVYAFDTGFVSYYRGWESLRREDLGSLWEHFVLNELHGHFARSTIHYWRSKRGHEVDFVLPRRGKPPVAVECKATARDFDPHSLKAFHGRYPESPLRVAVAGLERSFDQRYGDLQVGFRRLGDLIEELAGAGVSRLG